MFRTPNKDHKFKSGRWVPREVDVLSVEELPSVSWGPSRPDFGVCTVDQEQRLLCVRESLRNS